MRYRFDECEFDTDAIRLVVGGQEVAIQPQVADVLRVLIEERARVVSKEDLLDRVWGHTFVTESALTSRIKSARQAIGDDGKDQRLIRTVHGRGYQFIGKVREDEHLPSSSVDTRRAAAGLPTYASELIGREHEMIELGRLLDESTIVTVVGPGGVGKTRLAVACADAHRTHDIAFADLTTVRDPSLVVDHLATALGLHAAGPGAGAAIAEYIGDRPTLLVVDNVEHVIEAAPSIGELASRAEGLTVLATSRERLRIDGEHVFTLDPLPIHADPTADDSDPAAFELFVRTVRSVAPDVDIEHYRRHIGQICASVEGLPLAIELVAGQTRTLPPDMLAARLDDRLRSASASRRDLPERHRTMAETIDWSLRLLDRQELCLFTRLGVFVGDVPLPMIESVCADEELTDPLDVLSRLVDKSLVRSRLGPDGIVRFGMLELLRARAAELLNGDDTEASGIRRRHAREIANVAEAIDFERWGEHAVDATDLLTALLPEFRRAHDTAVELGEWEVAGRLAASYGSFWHRDGGLPEGRARIGAVLDHRTDLSREARGRLLAAGGLMALDVGQIEDARELWIAATEDLESTQLSSTLAYVLAGTAVTTIDEPERHDWAEELLDRAVSIADDGPPAALAEVLNMRGEFARATGDDASARLAYEGALRHAAEAGSIAVGPALANLAYVESHAGNFTEARELTRRALRTSIANGRRLMVAWSVGELAISLHGLGEHELAARLFGAAGRAMESLNAGRYPADVQEDERVVAGLIEQLGRQEFDRLLAAGRTLTLDQAVQLALGEEGAADL